MEYGWYSIKSGLMETVTGSGKPYCHFASRGRLLNLEFHLSHPTFTFSQVRIYDNVRNGSYPIGEREYGLGKISNGGCRVVLIFVADVTNQSGQKNSLACRALGLHADG